MTVRMCGNEIVRLLTLLKWRKKADWHHFQYLEKNHLERINERHRAHEPIKLSELHSVEYPEGYRASAISFPKPPKPKAPKAAAAPKKTRESGRDFLEKHGVMWCSEVSMTDARQILKSLRGMF